MAVGRRATLRHCRRHFDAGRHGHVSFKRRREEAHALSFENIYAIKPILSWLSSAACSDNNRRQASDYALMASIDNRRTPQCLFIIYHGGISRRHTEMSFNQPNALL